MKLKKNKPLEEIFEGCEAAEYHSYFWSGFDWHKAKRFGPNVYFKDGHVMGYWENGETPDKPGSQTLKMWFAVYDRKDHYSVIPLIPFWFCIISLLIFSFSLVMYISNVTFWRGFEFCFVFFVISVLLYGYVKNYANFKDWFKNHSV